MKNLLPSQSSAGTAQAGRKRAGRRSQRAPTGLTILAYKHVYMQRGETYTVLIDQPDFSARLHRCLPSNLETPSLQAREQDLAQVSALAASPLIPSPIT